jgi:hypothetical protein
MNVLKAGIEPQQRTAGFGLGGGRYAFLGIFGWGGGRSVFLYHEATKKFSSVLGGSWWLCGWER